MAAVLSSINLVAGGLLPVCEEPLWTAVVCEGDSSSFSPAFWLVGAHGGAGCSVLAEMLGPAGDAGQRWPSADEFPLCVVVARASVRELERAHQVVLQGLGGEIGAARLLGLVVVHHVPGKLPKPVRDKLEVLEALTSVWVVPFISGLQVAPLDGLAVWVPGDQVGGGRRRDRKKPVVEQVPPAVVEFGAAVFQAARDAARGAGGSDDEKCCESN
ncbi:hypothetical protein CMUST_15570 (plasmid) [Corynebacterium mustelae]|uniref:Uncharacterized protein n=1 Tax=Corynebacterium mustelae TaxID=571915 RepID=A0A0G3H6C5_9CORY|nr:DUF6668 family protein [Corynebacterium mustelae]AKK07403.1 hypothetical protein CMUST_15570 [Corynebacterium mustelae]